MAGLGGEGGGGSGAIRAGRAYVEMMLKGDKAMYAALARVEARFKALGSAAMKAGLAAAGTAVAAAPVVGVFASFDDGMRAVGARTEATAAQLQAMTDKALELGRTTSFSARSIAQLMNELGTAGFKPEQIIAATGAVLDLARATGTDAALSAQILGATLNQFELKAEDSARVADMLTAAANASAVSMADLGESLKYAGPVAKGLGLSLRDTIAALGGLGNAGITGSEAGTALRRISLLVATGGKEIKKLFDVDTAGKGMLQVLDEISQSVAGLDVATRASKMKDFFDILGITGATVLGKSAATIRDLQKAIGDSAGVASKTAQQMDAGLGGAIRKTVSAAEALAITVGDVLAPALAAVADKLQAGAGAARQFLEENKPAAIAIGAVAVALTGLGVAALLAVIPLKGLAVAAGVLTFALGAVKAAALLALSPFALVGLGAFALVAHFRETAEAGRDMAAGVARDVGDMAGQTDTTLGRLGQAFRNMADTFAETWAGVTAAVKSGDLELAFEVAGAGIKKAWFGMLADMGAAFKQFITDNRDTLVAIGGIYGGVKGGLVGGRFGPWGAIIGGGAGAAAGAFGADAVADALSRAAGGANAAARRDEADRQLKALIARANAGKPAAEEWEGAFAGFDEEIRMAKEMAKRQQLAEDIGGAFALPSALQQFGYGSKVGESAAEKQLKKADEQLKAQKQLVENTAKTVEELTDLVRAFTVR